MILLDDNKFNFKDLFILDLANNHQGDLEHAKRIIREVGEVVRKTGVRAALKLQFRHLDTFVHPEAKTRTDNKHIQRFLSTRLTDEQFDELVREIRAQGMITMCTPFDEASVDLIKQQGIEVIKIGSCSAQDWPLLEKVANAGKPVVISTGGLGVHETDKLVSFFEHRYVHFAIEHCVSIYPTPIEKLQLQYIERLRQRYPNLVIGFSTHEEPDNVDAIKMAYAKGARIFERHVGIATDNYKLNAYSSTPVQIEKWINAYQVAAKSCGPEGERKIEVEEGRDLETLKRGIFAKRDLKIGEAIKRDDVFFAFPIQPDQLASGKWRDGMIADRDYPLNAPLSAGLSPKAPAPKEIIYHAIHEVKGLLNQARVYVGNEFNVELSHHYGLDRFFEVGTTIVDCINREYCKKILIQLPGQQHPYHHHRKKEESFQVLAGDMWAELEGRRRVLYPGDILLVQRGVKHRFWSETGAIIEEVSSTHFNDDSIYDDPTINTMPREQRKTKLVNWGRHQFD